MAIDPTGVGRPPSLAHKQATKPAILCVVAVDEDGAYLDVTPPTAIAGFALETTLQLLLTELALKANQTETQPITATSLPLPTNAATDALDGALADNAVDELRVNVIEELPAGTQNIGDVDVASTPAVEASFQTNEESGVTLGSNGTTWTDMVNAATSEALKLVEVFNNTDGTLEVSFDSSAGTPTVHARIPPYSSFSRDFKALELKVTDEIGIREWATDQITTGYAIVNTAY